MSEKVDPKVLALAKKLHRAGLAEVRRVEGWSDRKGWKYTSDRTKNGMIGIAKYILGNNLSPQTTKQEER